MRKAVHTCISDLSSWFASPAFLQSECFVQYAAIQVLQWKAYTRTVSYTSCLSMKKTCQSIRNLSQELASYQGGKSVVSEWKSVDRLPATFVTPPHKNYVQHPSPFDRNSDKKIWHPFYFYQCLNHICPCKQYNVISFDRPRKINYLNKFLLLSFKLYY